MPYVGTQRAKDLRNMFILPEKVGDLCALAFIPMVEDWLDYPSWTTWSRIRRAVYDGGWKQAYLDPRKDTWIGVFDDAEVQNQIEAAAEVFYDRYVSKYEDEKFKENGDVL